MRDTLGGKRAALLSLMGDAPLFFPEFEQRDYAYLLPGMASAAQLNCILMRLAAAPVIVSIVDPRIGDPIVTWTQLKPALSGRELIFKNTLFAVYRKRGYP
jgi:hypothetical protein